MIPNEVEELEKKLKRFPIKEFSNWSLYLWPYQYHLGRVFIFSKRDGLVDLMDTTEEERKELFDVGTRTKEALLKLFNPGIFNWASMGNTVNQCHMHLIPRYREPVEFEGIKFIDESWGKNYAPYNKEFSVPEETMQKIADKIKEAIQ